MKTSASKIAIIGGGPAGISCAIQLKRFGIDCMIFEKNRLGGMLHNAHLIENYPGFSGGISGTVLVERLEQQAADFELRIVKEGINSAEVHDNQFILKADKHNYLCQRLVVATGTRPNTLNNISIDPEAEKYIYRDIYPLKETTNKDAGIIGAGDAAFDYAISLARHNKVIIFNRSNRIKALNSLVEKVRANPNINYIENAEVSEVRMSNNNSLRIHVNDSLYQLDLLVFATGRVPGLDFIGGSIKAGSRELTNTKRLFFIGDVKNQLYRQMAIAAGDGIKCAMQINEAENESNQKD